MLVNSIESRSPERSTAMKAHHVVLVRLTLTASACSPRASSPANQLSAAPSLDSARTLVIAVNLEPTTLVGRGLDVFIRGATPIVPTQLFHAALTQVDPKQTPEPLL